ncbi:MAG: anthranilate synthase component I family protein [Thermoleophilia bacterium]|nr:anthranilate synthase component I family protein [Thermoleophilia bacterium]
MSEHADDAGTPAIVTHHTRIGVRHVGRRVVAERLLARLLDHPYPVLAPHGGRLIVAADPVEVVRGPDVWDALAMPRVDGARPPAGGWIGLLGYDLGGTVESLPVPLPDTGGPPVAVMGRYETVAAIDARGSCEILAAGSPRAAAQLARLAERCEDPIVIRGGDFGGPVASSLPSCAYQERVQRIREHIRAGDCYQVNLAQRLRAPWSGSPLEFAARLWAAAGPSSHRGFMGLPEGTLVSASPERLVAVHRGVAYSEPIKGTAPAGAAGMLAASPKDRAEHVMIVDLVRNDLGRVARAGGVSVPDLCVPLRTAYVEHLVSRIRAELAPGVTPREVLRAMFPGGSVTGCPKVRAMEVIRDLEPVSRGPAYGSLVVVGPDHSIESSVLIRTAWLARGEARYWSGGAVTWDSDPVAEQREAMDKAAPFERAIAGGVV